MPKIDYVQPGDLAFTSQLLTCKNGLSGYSDVLGLSAAQLAAHAQDADYYAFIMDWQNVLQNSASQSSAWKKLMRTGGALLPAGAPVAPVLPADLPVPAPGIEGRFRIFARLIKASPGYNAGIGKVLGIEGSDKGGPDLATIAPILTAAVAGGQVQIGWGWQGHGNALDLIEIQVDRGAGFVLLTFDTTPGYIDTAPLPAAPAKWTYKAIYRVGDSQVGQWSPEVSLTVGG